MHHRDEAKFVKLHPQSWFLWKLYLMPRHKQSWQEMSDFIFWEDNHSRDRSGYSGAMTQGTRSLYMDSANVRFHASVSMSSLGFHNTEQITDYVAIFVIRL